MTELDNGSALIGSALADSTLIGLGDTGWLELLCIVSPSFLRCLTIGIGLAANLAGLVDSLLKFKTTILSVPVAAKSSWVP